MSPQRRIGAMSVVFDIGATGIKAARADGAALTEISTEPTPKRDREALCDLLARGLAREPEGVVVSAALCGRLETDTGVLRCANVPCIDGAPIGAMLAEALGRRVLVSNDADCFALAEARCGAGRGFDVVFGVILGTGVGGGLVIDGRLVSGAGEWGHGPVAATRLVDPPRDLPAFDCGCGLQGCVDTVGSARSFERLHWHFHGVEATSSEIVAGWREGDDAPDETARAWLALVAGPLAMAVNMVGADIVPVGGGLSNAPDLIAALDEKVRAQILRLRTDALVVPACSGPQPGLLGAALVAQDAGR